MNIDNGHIKFWDLLTDEERASGRWVKLGDGEFARAQEIDEHERRKATEQACSLSTGSHGLYDKQSEVKVSQDELRDALSLLDHPRSIEECQTYLRRWLASTPLTGENDR